MMVTHANAAVSCATASLVLSIVAVALPFWYYYELPFGSGKRFYGLWTSCWSFTWSGTQCDSFTVAVRALEILGLLLIATAGIIGTLKKYVMKENQIFPLVAGGQAIIAGVFMIIGAIVFGVNTKGHEEKGATLHAGFVLAIVSGIFAFGAGGLFIVSKSNKLSP